MNNVDEGRYNSDVISRFSDACVTSKMLIFGYCQPTILCSFLYAANHNVKIDEEDEVSGRCQPKFRTAFLHAF